VSIFPAKPVRYLITRGDLTEKNFPLEKLTTLDLIRSAANVGIEMIQIREKGLEARSLYVLVTEAMRSLPGRETRVLVNDRFDIALAAGADGVHLTSRSIPTEDVRRHVPDRFIIGVSTHSLDEVLGARDSGADFALFGNVFATPGKGEPAGLEKLTEICTTAAPFPVIAVGGIEGSNAGSVLDAGASGFAAIRYLNEFVSIGE
jgi:thiamine-phosphate pyrophosphorylase